MIRSLILSLVFTINASAVTLIDVNDLGEDWNTALDWENNAPPLADMDYLVEGGAAGIMRSPLTDSPPFDGRSLTFAGPNVRLILQHEGVAIVPTLALTDTVLIVTNTNGIGGENLSVEGANGIQLDNGAVLELRAPLRGTGSVEVLAAPAADGTTSGGIRLTGAGSDHAIDWVLNGAAMEAVTPGSIGKGSVTLLQGQLNFNYNVSLTNSRIRIQGEGFHLSLDQLWVFGGLDVLADGEVVFELPAGSYTRESLVNEVGFPSESVSGDGTLIIVDATSDSDNDGLLDSWETENIGNLSQVADGDADGDGLTNAFEFALGTNPGNDDSDSDGLKDGAETRTGFFVSAENAGSDPANADTDGDGLNDGEEVNTHMTSPVAADTDGDGLTDPAELSEHGTSPSNADTDGDGNDDRAELLVGTDPNDPESKFTLVEMGAVHFEESELGATEHAGGTELGWSMDVASGSPATVDTLDGVALADRQLLVNNGAFTWRSAIIPLGGFSNTTVRLGARVYQTSSGIESDDYIDFKVALSVDGGNTFPGEVVISEFEGTRTGGSGGTRTPIEDVFDLSAPADGPFVTLESAFGQIPDTATHIQVIIDVSNNSASERFLFDNLIVEGVSLIDPDIDTDGDGLTDLVEIQNGLDPDNGADAMEDLDNDGLSNLEEFAAGTRFTLADSDNDGLSDGAEVKTHETNPLDADSDNDSLSDGEELITYETNPKNRDTDGDGFGDALEIRFGADPKVADTSPPFGPSNAVGFTWFEEATEGDTEFQVEGSVELGWAVSGVAIDGGVIRVLDGTDLPDQQLYIHGGTLTFITNAIPVASPENVIVAVDARVYQTSSGIENNDFIDIFVLSSSDGGTTFGSDVFLLSAEGTRTNPSGGPRTPIEDQFPLDGPADGPFVTLESVRGEIPAGTTHVRVVINAENDSASERFVFDNVTVRERPTFVGGQDTDNDGIPDGWEFDNGFDRANAADAALDADSDELTNLEEFQNGTNPRLKDTDSDGLTDGEEVKTATTDPNKEDTDDDGLRDDIEVLNTNTNPLDADTDGDGFGDRLEVVLGGDPLVADPDAKFGPEGSVAFTSFEQATPGNLDFAFSGIEMGWQAQVTGEAGVTREIVGMPLPGQAFFIHNSALNLITDPVAISDASTAVVSVDVRVYQESTGIENDDFIDLRILASSDGVTFTDLPPFLMIEGTRTEPSGGDRTPIEDVLDIDGSADGDFVTFTSKPGDLPAGTTHLRVVIDAQNNSASEYFIFDHVTVLGEGDGVVPIPVPTGGLQITSMLLNAQQGATITWTSEVGTAYRVDYQETLVANGTWIAIAGVIADGMTSSATHAEAANHEKGFYRIVEIPGQGLE